MNKSLRAFLDSKANGFYFIGHSSALLKIGPDLILHDPAWGRDFLPYQNFIFHPQQVVCDEILPKVNAVCQSHIHRDHWTPEILKALRCPVHIMAGRPNLTATLADYAPVLTVPKLSWTKLTQDTEIFFLPHPTNSVDSACIIRNKDFSVYLGSDCFLDRNGCQTVANQGKIDIACIPWQTVMYYPALIEMDASRKTEEARRIKKQGLDQARMFVEIVRPSIAIPFGGNLLYCEGPEHSLNDLARPDEMHRGTAMNAGDYIVKVPAGLYIRKFPVKQKPKWKKLPPMDFAVELSVEQLRSISDRVKSAPILPNPTWAINVNDVVSIDCAHGRVYDGTVSAILRDMQTYNFAFDAPIFNAWASGDMSFSEALGSRRFKYSRDPDEYDAKLADWWESFL